MPPAHPNVMIVEGHDDLGSVVHLMKHHVNWPDDERSRPVDIRLGKSDSQILDKAFIGTILKQSGLKILSIMLDADGSVHNRWRSVRGVLVDSFPALPETMPERGVITENDNGLRIGVWIMPDNKAPGMLETFLHYLLPADATPSWAYAQSAAQEAKNAGAPYKDVHFIKAAIHTWLAWQDPPGERFGIAITRRILDPYSPSAASFICWFRDLYKLEALNGSEAV
jgi:hypothetical protein